MDAQAGCLKGTTTMTTNELSGQERTDDAPTTDERRAQWEQFSMVVLGGDGGGHINVRNDSHESPNDHIHTVHVEDGEADGCSCPHALYRDAHCKHQRAVEQRPLVVASADAANAAASPDDASAATTGKQVATDGGEVLPEITHHVESPEVGGQRYARCEGCGGESIFGESSILHDEECPRAEVR
jgi:hypothetical protein